MSEIKIDQSQWEELLKTQMLKQAPKVANVHPTKPATKPYQEKSFVATHYRAAPQSDGDTEYAKRDAQLYVVLHFYLRPGDTFTALQSDARNYAQTFQHAKIIAHSHSWDSPCSPAPKQQKCREVI